MKSFGVLALLALCLAASSVFAGDLADTVSSCGEGIPLPTHIYVDGCYENPCEVRNGDTVTFELVFTPRKCKGIDCKCIEYIRNVYIYSS